MSEKDNGFILEDSNKLKPSDVKIGDLLIFDVDHCMYIVCPNKKLVNSKNIPILDSEGNFIYENKTLEETIELADKYVKGVFARANCDFYIGFLTTGKNFRFQIYPAYKANRKDVIKPPFYSEVKKYLMEKYKFTDYIGLEADDLVMIARKHYCKDYKCLIVTTDKDILQTPYPSFDPKKGTFQETSKEDAYYFFWGSTIWGDTADNIKGLPGKGEAFVKKLLVDVKPEDYPGVILKEYIKQFGESEGVRQFYVNYRVLLMVDELPEGYIMPQVIECKYE